MKKLKTETYYFLISFILTSCIIYGFFGICAAYENMSQTAFGERKAAVSIDGGKLRILDFEFRFKKKEKAPSTARE
ncbi:MAG: hypothetical protein IKZ59_02885 [Clostridia bacterium]|nr:hypothetical protein [Clostridia bacterium]